MLFILNKEEKVVGVLNNKGDLSKITPYFDDTHAQDLTTGSETYEFSTLAETDQAKYLEPGNYVAFKDGQDFKMFNISEVFEEHADQLIKTGYCENIGLELLNEVKRPFNIPSANLKQFIENILSDTNWTLGKFDIGFVDAFTIDETDYKSVYALIQEYAVGKWGAELEFRVKIVNNRVVGRYIDVVKFRGNRNHFRFEYGANMDKVKRTVNTNDLVTALIGIGKNNLTFKSIAAADKPLNQDFVVDQDAFNRWNNKGSHIMGLFTCESESAEELLKLTRSELEKRKEPKITYNLSVQLLGEKVSLGDEVYVIDNYFNPPMYLSARVSTLSRSKSDEQKDTCTLANFKEIKSGITNDMRKLASSLEGYVNDKFPIGTGDIQDGAVTGDKVQDNTIHGTHLVAATITAQEIAADTITGSNIKGDTITGTHIKGDTITGTNIKASTIDGINIKATTITGDHIVGGSITGTEISGSTITGLHIQANTINGDHISSNTISATHIKSGTIVADNIAAATITGDKIFGSSITGDKISANTITGSNIIGGTITGDKISASTITGTNIKGSTITGDNIVGGSITGTNIAATTITGANIVGGTITGDKISAATIEGTNIKAATITGTNIIGGTITGDKISAATIEGTNIKGGTITGDKIFGSTITGDKISANTITASNITASTITGDKIAATTISASNIVSGTITATQIAASTITASKIAAATITADKIAATTITGDKIAANTITATNIVTGTITAAQIKTGTITAASGIIANGTIGSAQISTLDAAKISTGTLDAAKVTIQGTNGNLKIQNNKLQVFSGIGLSQVERVALGDVNGDGTLFGLRVRGTDGQTVLFDDQGITKEGITDGSIDNSKIDPSANIDGSKLNINTVVTSINGATQKINGSAVLLTDKTLDVKISEITTVQGQHTTTIAQHSSSISANASAISLKVASTEFNDYVDNTADTLTAMSSDITLNADEIALRVQKGDVISEINQSAEGVLISAEKIDIKGKLTIGYFNDDVQGMFGAEQVGTTTQTVIEGGRIKTGSIDADKIDLLGLTVYQDVAKTIPSLQIFNDGSLEMSGTLKSLNYNSDLKTGWKIDKNGNAELNQAIIQGKVILPYSGITNEGTGSNAVRFWSGASEQDRANAPFIVYADGSVKATKGTFDGTFTGSLEVGNIFISDTTQSQGSIEIKNNTNTETLVHIGEDNVVFKPRFIVGTEQDPCFIVDDAAKIVSILDNKVEISNNSNPIKGITIPNTAADPIMQFGNNAYNFNINVDQGFEFTSGVSTKNNFTFKGASDTDTVNVKVNGDLEVRDSLIVGTMVMEKKEELGNKGIDFIFI